MARGGSPCVSSSLGTFWVEFPTFSLQSQGGEIGVSLPEA